MNTTLSPPRRDPAPSFLEALRTDRVLAASLALCLAVAAPYATYFAGGRLGADYRDDITFAALAAIVAFASFAGISGVRSLSERRLRRLVGFAFAIWTAIELLELATPGERAGELTAFDDSLFIVFYVLLGFAALDDRRIGEAAETRVLRGYRRVETTLFACGMFVGFVVIPARLDPDSFASFLPSSFFYVALDGFLLALFVRRLLRAEAGRERLRWRLFAAAGALFLASDTLFFFDVAGRLDLDSHPLADLFWYTPHVAMILAVRLPGSTERLSGEVALGERELPPAPFAPSFLYAALVPLIQLIAEATEVSSGAAESQRAWAILLTALLGAVAAFHQRRIVIAHVALRREVVEARRRLGATRKLEAIGHLAAGVAHDFNNLLTVVIGRTELLLARGVDPAVEHDLQLVLRSAGRAADLTHELLAVGQKGMGVDKRVDVGALVHSVRPELAELCGARVELLLDTGSQAGAPPLVVEIDPAHLERVFRNLASNARDAMPQGGRLTIALGSRRLVAASPERGDELDEGVYASIVFQDTGAGMDEETLQHLFEPFFTTKSLGRGTGLGLATAYGLVRQHGGRLLVASHAGAGARFEVLLPLARTEEIGG